MQQTVLDFAKQLGLEQTIERAASFHPGKLHLGVVWNIPVEYDLGLKTSAGMCHYKGGLRIALHPALGGVERTSLAETFLHELAHAHAFLVYGWKIAHGHGEPWWEMMHQLGQHPRRTHGMQLRPTPNASRNAEELGL